MTIDWHWYFNVCSDSSDSFFLGRQRHGDTGVLCVYWESDRVEREKGVRKRTPGWYRSLQLLFLVCTPHLTPPLLHNITSWATSWSMVIIVLFTPPFNCPSKCIHAYCVCRMEAVWIAIVAYLGSKRQRPGWLWWCNVVYGHCTGVHQLTEVILSCSAPHIWSWVCSLSSLLSLVSALSLSH